MHGKDFARAFNDAYQDAVSYIIAHENETPLAQPLRSDMIPMHPWVHVTLPADDPHLFKAYQVAMVRAEDEKIEIVARQPQEGFELDRLYTVQLPDVDKFYIRWTWSPTGKTVSPAQDSLGVQVTGIDGRGPTYMSNSYAEQLALALLSGVIHNRAVLKSEGRDGNAQDTQ